MTEENNLTDKANMTAEGQKDGKAVVDYLTGDDFPEGTPKKIKESPNGGFYYEALRAGQSIRQVQRYAKQYLGESISRDTFHRFKKLIPPEQIMPQDIRDKYLKGIDAKIDVFQELQNAIEIQKKRFAKAMSYEEAVASGIEGISNVMFMEPIRKELEFLWRMLKEFASFQVSLGMLQTDRNVPRITGISEEQSEARKMVDGWNDDQKRKFIEEFDKINQMGKPEVIDAQAEVVNG